MCNIILCLCLINWMEDNLLYMLIISMYRAGLLGAGVLSADCRGWRCSVSSTTSQARWHLLGRSRWGDRRLQWASEGEGFLEQMVTWVGWVAGNPRCPFISSCVTHFFNGGCSWQATTTLRRVGNTLEFVLQKLHSTLRRCFKAIKRVGCDVRQIK